MVKNKLVSVNILTYNAQDLIGPCLRSILKQTYDNIEVLVIDNASTDKTLDVIRRISPKIRIIRNKNNLGLSIGYNTGIRESKGEYVLCLNQDVVLDGDFVKNAIEAIEVDDKIAAVQGKLYKIENFRGLTSENRVLDTTGLIMFKNRRIVNQGQGEKDKGQYKRGEIFGVDGAAPLYRRSALEDIKLPIFKGGVPQTNRFEYFDEDFFMYKEDVDLSWRFRLYGWKAIYEPEAVGYHLRGAGEKAVRNYIAIVKERRKISGFAKYYAFKNQRLVQIKNELAGLFFCHFYCILIKEMAAWFYALCFEKYAWKAILGLFKQIPNARRKRKIVRKRKRIGANEMKRWFM